MIVALDIETIGNPEAIALMPEPEVKLGNVKDPAKIAEKIAAAKLAQVEKAALNPLTARVVCYAMASMKDAYADAICAISDEDERCMIQNIMTAIGTPETRLVTWNGIGFDLQMIYKRAMILGVDPADFGAPPLPAWTKRYNTDKHYDLMQIWGGWSSMGFEKLDTVSRMLLGDQKTEGFDVTTIAALIETDEGREQVKKYCLQDTVLTYRLWEKMNGTLFA